MIKNMILFVLLAGCLLLLAAGDVLAGEETKERVTADIPVSLTQAKVVFDIGRASMAGDMPLALQFMDIMAKRFAEQGTKAQIIGIFYGEATYLVLGDDAYNARRHVSAGNPRKELISSLQNRGVQLEVCANAMKMHNVGNEDLLPGIKVNSGANLRLVQLMQEGFVRLQP